MPTKKTEETPEVVTAPEPVQPESPNGVFVLKSVSEDGSISTDVVPSGNVQATEVQTLLELGVLSWRRQIGL